MIFHALAKIVTSAIPKEILKANKTTLLTIQGLSWEINKKYASLILGVFARIVVLSILKEMPKIIRIMMVAINQEDSKGKCGLKQRIVL